MGLWAWAWWKGQRIGISDELKIWFTSRSVPISLYTWSLCNTLTTQCIKRMKTQPRIRLQTFILTKKVKKKLRHWRFAYGPCSLHNNVSSGVGDNLYLLPNADKFICTTVQRFWLQPGIHIGSTPGRTELTRLRQELNLSPATKQDANAICHTCSQCSTYHKCFQKVPTALP